MGTGRIYRSTLFTHERTQNEGCILHVNIPFYVSSDARQRFVPKKFVCTISFPKLKKIQNDFSKTIPCSIQICAQIPISRCS